MKHVRWYGIIVVCAGMMGMTGWAAATSLQQAEELLADRNYAEASVRLQEVLATAESEQDYVYFLLGNAALYQGDYAGARAWYARLLEEFPASAWTQKAHFKQAEAFILEKAYEPAQTLYEDEVIRLISAERKERIAQVYLDFAQEYFDGTWTQRKGQPDLEKQPDYARAQAFYELALNLELSPEKEEEIRFQIARCAFELWNYDDAIARLQQLGKDFPNGAYRLKAQYWLGQAYLQQGWLMQARQTLRDLAELHPDDAHAADAAFLLSRTYHIPSPQSDEELELGVKALRDFVEVYHDDARVAQAEYEVGVAYLNFGRYDDAAAAFLKYIEKYKDTPTGMSALQFEGLPFARYNLGLVYQRQRKFQEAIAVWQTYLQAHPSHKQWSDVQQLIIDTEFMIAEALLQEKQYDEARTAWERFLNAHPLDYRNPDIMARLGDILFEQQAYQDAIAQWKLTVSKYPETDSASRAQFEIGRTLETQLLKFEEAFEAYQLVTSGSYWSNAQQRIQTMQAKRLTVLTERVFRTTETAVLKLTTRNIETLAFKMYHLDLETYFRKMHTTAGVDALDIALIDPDTTWDVTVDNYGQYREFEQTAPMPFTAPGAYLVTCSETKGIEGVGYEATTFVLISDIDIIVKSTSRDVLVFAEDMRAGQPAADTQIVISDGQKVIFEGQTGADGVMHEALEDLPNSADIRVLAYRNGHYAVTTLSTEELRYVVGLDVRGYIYTDRPAYRPGQQVNMRGILREVDAQGALRVPVRQERQAVRSDAERRNENVTTATESTSVPLSSQSGTLSPGLTPGMYDLNVISSQGNPVYQGQVTLNEFGSFAADFTLSASAPVGEYRIAVSDAKHTYSGSFLVEQYALQTMQLTIDTDREVYFRGETITGTIKAAYYYGAPVKDKAISYALAGLETLSGITDANGAIAFTVDTRNFTESQPLTLTARLDDERVQTGKTVWLATRGFACSVSTLRDVYLVDENIEVNFAATDPSGAALTQELRFSVLKRESTPFGEIAEVKVDEQTVQTAADGAGKALIQIAAGGDYVLRAEGIDRFGNPVSGEAYVFISGQDDEIKLRILSDREEFRVGETSVVTLFSRAEKGLALATYEAESILSYQILTLTPDANPFALNIGAELAPNFTLAVAQMDNNQFHQAQKEFAVIQGLNIAIAPQFAEGSDPEHPSFQPGDTVTVDITTTDHNGNSVSAELSLALVDEALYAQYADALPAMRDVFYDQWRDLLTSTETSCTFTFEAATRAIAEEVLAEEERFADEEDMLKKELAAGTMPGKAIAPMSEVQEGFLGAGAMAAAPAEPMPSPALSISADVSGRMEEAKADEFLAALREYFPETGYWNPQIVTDESGKATVTIELPDSTTAWRLTSRGVTRATLVGEATAGLVTKLPFFADLKTPQMLTEGDQAVLLASVHNHSGAAQEVRTTFTADLAGEILERQEQTVTADDGAILETAYPLDLARMADLGRIAPVALELNAVSDTQADRVKREVNVRPWGIAQVVTASGVLHDDGRIDIALPDGQEYLYQEMRILLNPAIDRTLLDLADAAPEPFCVPEPLYVLQSSAVHEALVILNALTDANTRSLSEVEGQTLQSRLRALLIDVALRQNQEGGWNWTGAGTQSDPFISADAVILLTLAQRQGYSITPGALSNGIAYLKRAFQATPENELKTDLLYALAIAGDLDFAHVNRVYRERNSLTTSGLALLTLIYAEIQRPEIAAELLPLLLEKARRSQDPTTGKQLTYWPSDSIYPYLQGDVETTALAMLAVQKAQPAAPEIAESLAWLYTQRVWIGWGSAQTNARVSAALLEYYARSQYQAMRYTLSVDVNGAPIETVTLDSAQSSLTLPVPANLLQRNNVINLAFEGRGALNYVVVLQGVSRDVRKTTDYFEVWRYYEPAPLVFKGQEIQRGFSVLDGSYSSWRNALTQIPLGGFGRVTLEFQQREYDNQQPYRNTYMILAEPIPAGCSVLEQSLTGNFLDYDIVDGAIVFYVSNSSYGSISYDLYGYLPGTYRVLPTQIRAAYQAGQIDYGEPYTISVFGRGESVTEVYRKTPDELYYYGKALFDEQQFTEAETWLRELFAEYRLRPEPYRETARMLLYIAIAGNNSRDMVQYFEILKEKYPDLVMAFADILRVGQAYREINEFERATQVFKAIAEASFLKDVQISGALEAQGEFLTSLAHTRDLLLEYPDTPTTETTLYALAQLLATESSRSADRSADILSASDLLQRAIAMLHDFLVRYPENPIADEVSFAIANAYLDLEAFDTVIPLTQRFQQRYPKSPFLSSYQYIEGYAHFELGQYDEALRLCRTVATALYPDARGQMAPSDHKDLAQYITGQIYHSLGQPEQAIAEYAKVKDLFPDAREAIDYFRRKALAIEEVSTFRPGESVQIPLTYRNIGEVNLLVYRVDLMTLYLLQKNLNTITQVNLAGITPYHQETVTFDDESADYAEHAYTLNLPLKDEGAYLVVVKEAEIDTSGMALVSALKLDVEEDSVSGRVRVNVLNADTGRYENNVHVKVIGSNDSKFVSGDTDLRGIMIADNIHGAATVIARKGDQYAFYRGSIPLQPPDTGAEIGYVTPSQAPADMRAQATEQLRESNLMIQQQSADYLRSNLYRNEQKGVAVQSAY